jgi:hypothetical protein
MRPVTVDPRNPEAAIRALADATQENDIVDLAQSFSINGTVTPTTTLNVTAPTIANIANFLATFIEAMQRGNLNRST